MRNARSRNRDAVAFFLFCFAFILLNGCQAKSKVPDSRSSDVADAGRMSIQKVVVMPVQNMFATYGAGVSYSCPLCGRSFIIGDVAPDAEEFLTNQIFDMIKTNDNLDVIPPSQALGAQATLMFNSQQELSEIQLLTETGKSLDADALLVARVYRFKHLKGSTFAAESPASVSLSLLLVNAADGRLLWESHFTETQRSLFENLYNYKTFFSRKAKWLSAEELAVYGLEDMLKSFPVR